MIDLEKVIKGLEYHLKELTVEKTCYECPYWGDNPCEIQLIANAIALLKEQQETIELQGSLLTLAHAAMSHGKKEGTRDIARPGRN